MAMMMSSVEVTWEIIVWLDNYHNDACYGIASRTGSIEELAMELEDYVWDLYSKDITWDEVTEDDLSFVQWYGVAKRFEQYIGKAWSSLLKENE